MRHVHGHFLRVLGSQDLLVQRGHLVERRTRSDVVHQKEALAIAHPLHAHNHGERANETARCSESGRIELRLLFSVCAAQRCPFLLCGSLRGACALVNEKPDLILHGAELLLPGCIQDV